MSRALVVVPVILLVLGTFVLGLLGLLCGRERRKYVMSRGRQRNAKVNSIKTLEALDKEASLFASSTSRRHRISNCCTDAGT